MSHPSARDAKADALLDAVRDERRGKLKIFIGAAPGVGKTYAMLSDARELARQGVDVVVGVVETHGRRDTAALLDGLEVLPRRSVEYKGHVLQALDLDALLGRRPQVALVDELAHRNVPGSRHERRWQDVEELLDAGIDVCSTVNIQHLESLNDVVRSITGVRVTETVPDAFVDRARDLVLVDLPARELIERLRQGKVYVPEHASAALANFFTASNLTALRELVIQTVGDRVDADLRDYRVAHGLPQAAPLKRRVLVAIDGRENTEYLVRAARRIAERRQAPLTVAYVDRGDAPREVQSAVIDGFALARRLGADTVTLRGSNVADEVVAWAGQHGVSTVVIGRTRERPLARMVNRTITQQILQKGAHFELTIINTPYRRARARRLDPARVFRRSDAGELAYAAFASLAAVGVAALAESLTTLQSPALVFITAVTAVAVRARRTAAVLSAVLCFLAYDFLFVEPRYSFTIARPDEVVAVVLFLAVALIVGHLAARLRVQLVALRAANEHTQALSALGRKLSAAADGHGAVRATLAALRAALGAETAMLSRADRNAVLTLAAADPPSVLLDATALAAADWAERRQRPAGRHTDTLSSARWWLLPVRPGSVLAASFGEQRELAPEQRELALAMVQDLAQTLERTDLVAQLEAARVSGETERLRAALLSSISHDLRSPLASMIGAASSLIEYDGTLTPDDRRALLEATLSEGQRLDRYIQNLLDMTRLGHGGLSLSRDWVAVEDLVGAVLARLRKFAPGAAIETAFEPGLPLLYVHPALIEQALFNIAENAVKFSPPGEPVRIEAGVAGEHLLIDTVDRGPGIPAAERERIFDPFYTAARGDRGPQGTGLGLAICQGMVGAHGGQVEALPGPDGSGTRVRVRLPLPEPPSADTLSL